MNKVMVAPCLTLSPAYLVGKKYCDINGSWIMLKGIRCVAISQFLTMSEAAVKFRGFYLSGRGKNFWARGPLEKKKSLGVKLIQNHNRAQNKLLSGAAKTLRHSTQETNWFYMVKSNRHSRLVLHSRKKLV